MITSQHIHVFLVLISLTITQRIFGQNSSDNFIIGEKHAREILRKSLNDSTQHNIINLKDTLIKNKGCAIKIAESILFEIYGAKEIIKQRPYDAYNIDNYWVINGTIPRCYKGGTFLIIIDAYDSRIIRISHGK